jgi:hypothetical protein
VAPDPHNPTDPAPSTIEANLWPAAQEGQFQATAGGRIRCLTCGTESPASDQRADQVARLEGTSDPDDMLLILPVRCPACDTCGSLSLGYGPQSAIEDAEVLRNLDPPTGGRAARRTPR